MRYHQSVHEPSAGGRLTDSRWQDEPPWTRLARRAPKQQIDRPAPNAARPQFDAHCRPIGGRRSLALEPPLPITTVAPPSDLYLAGGPSARPLDAIRSDPVMGPARQAPEATVRLAGVLAHTNRPVGPAPGRDPSPIGFSFCPLRSTERKTCYRIRRGMSGTLSVWRVAKALSRFGTLGQIQRVP